MGAESILGAELQGAKAAVHRDFKRSPVEHVLFFINDDTLEFEPLDDVVHADEKWLYEDKDKRSYLLFPGENPTHHIRKSKKFIPKTMFLAAI
ncbi:hypothetical protein F443_05143 [Phytophthora nicotianae P1569]|uniref:Uncharacterized protein n=1 Tax=Phytophthora nicotianae P1569 TaxID=1317065 RepID=V9FJB9_PHYNI|nr:hypothetical protein F443_05143 [Phytophthora nicotianae P1569]